MKRQFGFVKTRYRGLVKHLVHSRFSLPWLTCVCGHVQDVPRVAGGITDIGTRMSKIAFGTPIRDQGKGKRVFRGRIRSLSACKTNGEADLVGVTPINQCLLKNLIQANRFRHVGVRDVGIDSLEVCCCGSDLRDSTVDHLADLVTTRMIHHVPVLEVIIGSGVKGLQYQVGIRTLFILSWVSHFRSVVSHELQLASPVLSVSSHPILIPMWERGVLDCGGSGGRYSPSRDHSEERHSSHLRSGRNGHAY